MTNTTDTHCAQLGCWKREPDEGDHLDAEPDDQGAVETGPGADPAADQVGDDPHELVEQEQEGDRDGRVAELVEVQQHEHPQRAVGERERPVAGGDEDVVAQLHEMPCVTLRRCVTTLR
jgi:hypothetical protein